MVYRKGCKVKLVCAFDDETYDQIRALADANECSLAEQIRTLVEWGLMAEAGDDR